MGFDPEYGRFTPENYRALEAQRIPLVFEMQHGDIYYIDQNDVLLDYTGNTWIERDAVAYDSTALIQEGVLNNEVGFGRIICTHDGLIVDFSHLDQKSWQKYEDRYNRNDAVHVELRPQDYLKVVYAVHNLDELEPVEKVLAEQYNIVLVGSELPPLLEEIERLLELEDYEESDLDDGEGTVGTDWDDEDETA